jgi:outer membrane protein assembly factor BamB
MMNNLVKRAKTYLGYALLLFAIMLLNSCASTKEASIPQGWNYNLDWSSFKMAEVTPSEQVLVQNKEDMILLDGSTGEAVKSDIRKRGGFFSEMGRAYKEQIKEEVLLSQRVETKYLYRELPSLNTILFFNRVDGDNTVQSFNLETGEENWKETSYRWNLNDYRDATNIAVNQMMGGALGAKATSEVALQTRMLQSMVQEVPEKDAFLFRTVDKLYLIDHESGSVIWTNEEIDGTGIGAVEYLPERDELLLATDMAGLKDALKDASEDMNLKQVLLLDADKGNVVWQSEYRGRSEQLADIKTDMKVVQLNFYGGATELFNFDDGSRLFGTRDGEIEGGAKIASFSNDYNLVETPETAMPRVIGDAVYAVNPKRVKAAGVPDKQIQKFDLETGEVIWEQPLENTLDIRDMRSQSDNLLVRLSSPQSDRMAASASSIVGKKKPLGFYAYSKQDGSLAWKLTEPFEKHVTNAIYGKDEAWAAGDESIYKFSLTNGEVLADSSLADLGIGQVGHIYDTGNNIVVLGAKGMALVKKSNLKTIYSDTPKGRVKSYDINDRFLVMSTEKVLANKRSVHIYNLTAPSKITDFTLEPPENNIYGELGARGYFTLDNFKQVLTITKTGITSYKVW